MLIIDCLPLLSTSGGWFGVAVTAFVTSTKLSYAEPGLVLVTTSDGQIQITI